MSVATGGAEGDNDSLSPSISADGRYVAFHSFATDLVAGDTNGVRDVFVHDRQSGTTERVSIATGGTQANGASDSPSISPDGRFVAFESVASNLVAGDTNGEHDVFILDRGAPFPSICFGDGSGTPCPCGNDGAPGGGCNTGFSPGEGGPNGAELTAFGDASEAFDTLVLIAQDVTGQSGLFFQGDQALDGGSGIAFGDGLRCCGTNVIRIQLVTPTGPEPATAVSSEVISNEAGQPANMAGLTRCYQYWFRNPGQSLCGSNFNLSNAVLVTWAP